MGFLGCSRQSAIGQGLMFTTAIFWGSNPVAIKALALTKGPPSSAVVACAQTLMAALLLALMNALSRVWEAARGRRQQSGDAEQPLLADGSFHGEADHHAEQHAANRRQQDGAAERQAALEQPEPMARCVSFAGPDTAQLVEASSGLHGPGEELWTADQKGRKWRRPQRAGVMGAVEKALTWRTTRVLLAGSELGALTFLANSAQIVGFQGSQASRGAFLLRTSIIGTPILASLAALPVAPLVWVGCLTGFAGGVLVAFDNKSAQSSDSDNSLSALLMASQPNMLGFPGSCPSHPTAATSLSLNASMPALGDTWPGSCWAGSLSSSGVAGSQRVAAGLGAFSGDAAVLASAAIYCLVIVRQSIHAPRFRALDLAATKLSMMAALSSLWLAGSILLALHQGRPASAVWPGWREAVKPWLILLWPAVGPWSLGELSQILAQSRISPALAQIILSIDPLISVLFAGFISAAEQQLGLKGWAGGILLIVACIIAGVGDAISNNNDDDSASETQE